MVSIGGMMREEYIKGEALLHDRYKIIRKMQKGGFGQTWLAEDVQWQQIVVLKELLKEEEKKTLNEARRMAKFQNNSVIVKILGFFEEEELAYIVMEYVKGSSLREFLERLDEPMGFRESVEFMQPVFQALREIHKKGMIHRDLTPDNILIKEDGTLKIIDFGSAREYEDDRTKTVVVKSGYAPLEQYNGKEKQGPWTDVYGICAVLYEMLTGTIPPEVLERMESDELYPPSMYGTEITPEEEAALMKGLSLDAKDRYQNIKELEKALTGNTEIQKKEEVKTSPVGVKRTLAAFVVVLAVSVICVGGSILRRSESYAGNYARGSGKYEKFRQYILEHATAEETLEDGVRYAVDREAALNWGEPCNWKHFTLTSEEWLEEMKEYGWELDKSEKAGREGYIADLKDFGAIQTRYWNEDIYIWQEQIEVWLLYDPVNEKIMDVNIYGSSEDVQEVIGSFAADSMYVLTEYKEADRDTLTEKVQSYAAQKKEYQDEKYVSYSLPDVAVMYRWSSENETVEYECLPYEESRYFYRHGYYWP